MQNNNAVITEQKIRCISHEIRNQLSICDIYTEILKKHLIKENIKNNSIENALNCIQNAVKLIGNELIELKSFENINIHILDADNLIAGCINLSKAYTQDKKIEFRENYKTGEKILADEYKLQGCIINIIKNAIESIGNIGFIEITTNKKENNLIIKISNNGEKIPQSEQDKIFEEGYTSKKNGSGIGLHLCKENLEKMNGSIELTQATDKITEFSISIPIKAL